MAESTIKANSSPASSSDTANEISLLQRPSSNSSILPISGSFSVLAGKFSSASQPLLPEYFDESNLSAETPTSEEAEEKSTRDSEKEKERGKLKEHSLSVSTASLFGPAAATGHRISIPNLANIFPRDSTLPSDKSNSSSVPPLASSETPAVPPSANNSVSLSGSLNSLYSLTSSLLSSLPFPSTGDETQFGPPATRLFNSMTAKKQISRLKNYSTQLDSAIFENKSILVRSLKRRQPAAEFLNQLIAKHRSNMAMNEVRVLEESIHVQSALFENADLISKSSIIALQERRALANSLLDELNSKSPALTLSDEHFFQSATQICRSAPSMGPLLSTKRDLEEKWKALRLEYVRVCKESSVVESLDRTTRILNILEQFIEFYNGRMNGEFRRALQLEYEFSRFILDERTKEGQIIAKWFSLIHGYAEQLRNAGSEQKNPAGPANPLTLSFIEHFLSKFESTFVNDYSIPFDKRIWVRLLIHRIVFPRLWNYLQLIDSELLHSEQENFTIQSDWLRAVTQEQLGIPAAFCVSSDKIKAFRAEQKANKEKQISENEAENQVDAKVESPALSLAVEPAESPARHESAGTRAVRKISDLLKFELFETQQQSGRTTPSHINESATDPKTESAADLVASPLSLTPDAAKTRSAYPMSPNSQELDLFSQLFADSNQSTAPAVSSTANSIPSNLFDSFSVESTELASQSEVSASSISVADSILPPSIENSLFDDRSRHSNQFSSTSSSRLYRPYNVAMEYLEELNQLRAPLDMLQCLLTVSKSVYEAATEAAAINSNAKKALEGLGADSFFPIYLYVLIHSDIPDIHLRLRLMQTFALGPVVREGSGEFSEHSYYLTCLESAIHYIDTAQPENF